MHLFFIFALLPISKCGPVFVKGDLLSVIVFSRHGDRVPTRFYTNDPYQNISLWSAGLGQVVNTGKLRHYELGKWFRARYAGFLPENYSEKDIYVRSTDTDRTLVSAAANLAGLYPPKGAQIWNPDLLWQPIPIHTVPLKDDQFLRMKKFCAKFDKLYNELLKTEYFVNIDKENEEMYKFLSTKTGHEIKHFRDVESLYNTLLVESFYNLTLPGWTKSLYPEKLEPLGTLTFASYCYTPALSRLKVGVFLDFIITHFEKVIDNPKDNYKFVFLSGHESGLGNVLMALEIFDYQIPFFASTLIFELRKIDGKNMVNMFYKRLDEPKQVTLKSCEFNCEIWRFKKILKNITVNMDQWEKECVDY